MQHFLSVYIGFDHRETNAYLTLRHTLRKHIRIHPIRITPLILPVLQKQGLYTRPMSWKQTAEDPLRWDDLSDSNMSTEFSNSRFLTYHLEKNTKLKTSHWAIFADCDILCRGDLFQLNEELDQKYAVMCVQHDYVPSSTVKMDGQIQYQYARKNWSSMIAFNMGHPSNEGLTLELINSVPGRDLHRFCWLQDHEIGALRNRWNYLVNTPNQSKEEEPIFVHFTNGTPEMRGHEDCEYAEEWFAAREEALLCLR